MEGSPKKKSFSIHEKKRIFHETNQLLRIILDWKPPVFMCCFPSFDISPWRRIVHRSVEMNLVFADDAQPALAGCCGAKNYVKKAESLQKTLCIKHNLPEMTIKLE
jgi:hypothetical protein